ncbi:MAG: MFS transporter [Parcubacteria group bacterium]
MNDKKRKTRQLATILFTNLISVIGMSVVIPILPFYVESLGASPIIVTALFSVFSICSFVSAPYLGSLSEKLGRKPVLMASIASTSVGWFVFAIARNPILLFVGRIIDGLAAGDFSIAQNILGDIAEDEKERKKFFGFFGATFAAGFILGPVLGGLLAEYSPSAPFFIVSGLAVLNLIMVHFVIPETNMHADKQKKVELNPINPILKAAKDRELRKVMLSWFFFMMSVSGVQSVASLYMKERFMLRPMFIGLAMVVGSVIVILNQIFGMKFWTASRKDELVERGMLLVASIGYFLIIGNIFIAVLGALICTITESTLRAFFSERIFSRAKPGEQGEIIGTQSSLMSLAFAIMPMFAGLAFINHKSLPFIASSILTFVAFTISTKFLPKEFPSKVQPENLNADELSGF